MLFWVPVFESGCSHYVLGVMEGHCVELGTFSEKFKSRSFDPNINTGMLSIPDFYYYHLFTYSPKYYIGLWTFIKIHKYNHNRWVNLFLAGGRLRTGSLRAHDRRVPAVAARGNSRRLALSHGRQIKCLQTVSHNKLHNFLSTV